MLQKGRERPPQPQKDATQRARDYGGQQARGGGGWARATSEPKHENDGGHVHTSLGV